MRYVICQDSFFAGQIEANKNKIIQAIRQYVASEVPTVFITPELAISGYPALDLYMDPDFLGKCQDALGEIEQFSRAYPNALFIIGCPSEMIGTKAFNVAYHIQEGRVISYTCKKLLPEYDIFWDNRYFHSGYEDPGQTNVVSFQGKNLGVLICEDQWDGDYNTSPYQEIMDSGAETVISLNASPFCIGKVEKRIEVVKNLVKSTIRRPKLFIYTNMVGGNDGYDGEQVFDGNSMVFTVGSKVKHVRLGKAFLPDVMEYEDGNPGPECQGSVFDEFLIHKALVCGIQDYFFRCHIKKALLGLSGGIDSAVTACLLVDALGKENVYGFAMPSQYSSRGSINDAQKLGENLGIKVEYLFIEDTFKCITQGVLDSSKHYNQMVGQNPVAEENLQARVRGNILMTISNKIGSSAVVCTGNKTEMALGYTTLHGDMAGGLSPIGDLNKLRVYALAKYLNRFYGREVIPEASITKPPSAELALDQTDEQGLGANYEVLSPVVDDIVENHYSLEDLKFKYPEVSETVLKDTLRRIYRNEFKRRQAAPSIKVTPKAFGSGRKIPISYSPLED